MEKFTRITGIAAPLPRINVDTDAIMPKRWCVSTARSGFGQGLFGEWRYDAADHERPDFVLNQPAYRSAKVLVVGENYGCGSSREMAVWGHLEFGIRAIVAPSFAAIFEQNCFKNGLLPVTLPQAVVDALFEELARHPGGAMTVDLELQEVRSPEGSVHCFAIAPARRRALLLGLDEIALTLEQQSAIESFQAADRVRRPWAWPARAVRRGLTPSTG